jgi:hypothetical protein
MIKTHLSGFLYSPDKNFVQKNWSNWKNFAGKLNLLISYMLHCLTFSCHLWVNGSKLISRQNFYYLIFDQFYKIGSFILPHRRATSSGSNNLNSRPLPVQVIKFEFAGSSNKATKNCHSWSVPFRPELK